MRGIAEGLRDGLVEETEKQRYYEMIVGEVRRLTRLVNDLLELSRLQAASSAFEMEKVDPLETLYELHDRTSFSIQFKPDNIALCIMIHSRRENVT